MITKDILIEQVNYLFNKYYSDLTNKNFNAINSYFPDFYKQEEYVEYQKYFVDNFDVFYNPEIIAVIVTGFNKKEKSFRLQLNIKTINFAVSDRGNVIKGMPEAQKCTKYWDIVLVDNYQFLIKGIENTFTSKSLKLDSQVKRQSFADFRWLVRYSKQLF